MEGLIRSVNRIQDVFISLGREPIELPKIAVVGSQSAGKSSVLEALVGKTFLPRGTGIVTRCPLVLQLNHCPLGDRRRNRLPDDYKAYHEWGEFLHAEGKIFAISEIREEIENQTEVLAGSDRGICSKAISLRIYSPNVIDLTLVDLPGITKVPVGNQPKDIEQQIVALIREYIDKELCIILAVITANTDMATNESLKLAQECDPDGKRTLAVVTKIDLMDEGTDANDMLNGVIIPVKLGIVGVVNRSQKDINDNKPLQTALADEEKFFEKFYPNVASRMGTAYLGKALHRLLMNHIHDCLPNMQRQISEEIIACREILQKCGEEIQDPKKELLNYISNFVSAYHNILEGGSRILDAEDLVGGAKICHIFNNRLKKDIQAIDPLKSWSLDKVLMAVKNANGPRPPFFVSEAAFEALVIPEISKLLKPSLLCIEMVQEELFLVVQDCFIGDIFRFPALQVEITNVVRRTLQKFLPGAREMINNLIEMEKSYITYNRLDFLKDETIHNILVEKNESNVARMPMPFSNTSASPKFEFGVPRRRRSNPSSVFTFGSPSERTTGIPNYVSEMSFQDKKQVQVIAKMLSHYFDLVKGAVQDLVPKSIMCFFVRKVKDQLNFELMSSIYNEDGLQRVFVENESITEKRRSATEKLMALESAMEILSTCYSAQYGKPEAVYCEGTASPK